MIRLRMEASTPPTNYLDVTVELGVIANFLDNRGGEEMEDAEDLYL